MSVSPTQEWWSAREIAERALPDMPNTRQGVEAIIRRHDWRSVPGSCRRRAGRGGGWEYLWTLFPMNAQKALLAEVSSAPEPSRKVDRAEAWRAFEELPDSVCDKARARLDIIQAVEAMTHAGTSKFLATEQVAEMNGVTSRTIWNWFEAIEGVRLEDRLPYLAPQHRNAKRHSRAAEGAEDFWDFIKGSYLRIGGQSFSQVYRDAVKVARSEGWATLPEQTMRRRKAREISKVTEILARKGIDALKAKYPPQTRDKSSLHAMEAVNADYHKFDVFVRWPRYEGDNEGEVIRPQMVAFHDIYSGRLLSWRLDRTPNKTSVGFALGDMIERFGIPEHVLLDNGREFANKFLTGQAKTRHRFKIKEDDIPGVLTTLGCKIHWATPYSGQSKPIERAFRDLCDSIAMDPRFAGAYTGNRPDAQPENYGSRAIELDEFLRVVAEGIEEHNARQGRNTSTAMGRSFLETFDASYASAPIRKATEEQRRLWLMGAEGIKADTRTGVIRFMKNEFWSEWMHQIAGNKIVARFDPGDFKAGLHIYALSGEYLGHAEPKLMAGFFDIEEARAHNAARRKWMRAEKDALEAARHMSVTDISAHLDRVAPPPAEPVEARIVRPMFDAKPKERRQVPEASQEIQQAQIAMLDEVRASKPRPQSTPEDEPLERFRRALEIEGRLKAGKAVSRDEERWLSSYQSQPEYRANMLLYEDFGDGMFG